MKDWWYGLEPDVRLALMLGVLGVGLLVSLMIDMIVHGPF